MDGMRTINTELTKMVVEHVGVLTSIDQEFNGKSKSTRAKDIYQKTYDSLRDDVMPAIDRAQKDGIRLSPDLLSIADKFKDCARAVGGVEKFSNFALDTLSPRRK